MKRPRPGCAGFATKRTSSTNSDPSRAGPSGAHEDRRLTPRIALTSGEPAGVGPELCLAIARETLGCELVCLGDRSLFEARAAALKLPVKLAAYDATAARAAHIPD